MDTFENDRNLVYKMLNQSRGNVSQNTTPTMIETRVGCFEGELVLEGFAANAEDMCNENDANNFNQEFYEMMANDDRIIFELSENENYIIPHIDLKQLKEILFKKMKLNKACDIFKLSVEHLRYCGDSSLQLIMHLINKIIDNINVLSSPQLNTSIASVIHKGKGKSVFHHKSYRMVRVTPLFSRIIDEYMRPVLINIVRPIQPINHIVLLKTFHTY